MKPDQKIWENFKMGEDFALSHIYYQNVQFLYRYGKKFTKNKELIKDTIQDLFFDLIRTRENLGSTDNIRLYLITAFRRRLFQNLQKQTPIIENNEDYIPDTEIVYSAEHEIMGKEELTERQKAVQKALSEISPKQREILYYKFTCNFDYEEICEITSLKYDSARKQVFRAIKALKKQLSDTNLLLLFLGVFPKNIYQLKK